MTKQERVETSFLKMLNNNPNKICLNAIEFILKNFEEGNIDCIKMRQWAKEKAKKAQCFILPLAVK